MKGYLRSVEHFQSTAFVTTSSKHIKPYMILKALCKGFQEIFMLETAPAMALALLRPRSVSAVRSPEPTGSATSGTRVRSRQDSM